MKWNKAGEKLKGKQKTEDPCVGRHDTSIAKVAQNVWHNLLSYRGSNKIVSISVADPGFSKWGGAVLSQMGGRTSCFQVKSA